MSSDQGTAGGAGGAWNWVLATDRFVRLHFLCFSGLWPLLGAASVRGSLTTGELSALLAVMLCFHIYTIVLNDVVDLPIDRTNPRRQHDPLVRGTIRPWQALVIALVQPALTVPLTVWLGGTWWAHATLAIGFVLMGAYNVWGKRCPFPPLTDAIQGIAWGTLAIYAAQALGAEPNALTWMVAAYVVGYTLLFNGIHGPLRDLATDFASGARTTAIFLGARPAPDGGDPGVPRAVAVFAYGVLAGLIGLHVALLVRNDFGYEAVTWIATTIAVAAVDVVIILLHPRVVRPRGPVWEVAYRLQLYLVMMSLPVAFFAHISAGVLLALLLLTVISLPLFEWTPNIARWTWLTIRSAVWPASGKRPTLRTPTD